METKTYNTAKNTIISTPLPKETRTYKPVSHKELIDLTLESIYQSGFTLDRELYSSAKDGLVANGRFTIKDVRDAEMQLEIGWQNSYDKSLSLKFAIGTRIFICANGCVSGDFGSFKRKHVGEVQTFTPQAIVQYIKQAGEAFERMQKERDAMKEIEITKRIQAELIGRMFIEEKFITSTQLNIIQRELCNPTHDYKSPNSLWELYNFTTFAMKELHPNLWMRNHIDAHSFFVGNSNIVLPTTEIVLVPENQLELFEADAPNYEL
jgi:hypothetical protein